MKKNFKKILAFVFVLVSFAFVLGNFIFNNDKAYADEDIYCKVVCVYNGNEIYNQTFRTKEEYFGFIGNLDYSRARRWGTYDITLYQDNSVVCTPCAAHFNIYTQGHTFKFANQTGDLISEYTFSDDSIEYMSIYDCPDIDPDFVYNIAGTADLYFINSTMDGKGRTYTHDIFNISNGGALVLQNSTIMNFNLEDNSELVDFLYDSNWYSQDCIVQSLGGVSSYIKNINSDDHGIMRLDCYGALVKDMIFENCRSEEDGGALFISHGIVEGSTFNNCYSDGDGGAIYMDDDYGQLNGCTFNNCSCDDDGGAVYVDVENGWIRNCTFNSNTSGVDGGAICINEDEVVIDNCVFNNNHAKDDGGAIYVTRGTDDVEIKNSSFSGNHADDDCDNVDGRSDTKIINCGSVVSNGNVYIIIVIVAVLIAAGIAAYFLSKKNKKTSK